MQAASTVPMLSYVQARCKFHPSELKQFFLAKGETVGVHKVLECGWAIVTKANTFG